ncbi:MAG: hypothetical protein OEW60_02965 [Thiovulaceae bacterium]|nr:hypothetical protein [Sulfurimonadaceae bacterium]
MGITLPEELIVSSLEDINLQIATTINSPASTTPKELTIKDAPKIVAKVYKMNDAFVEFVGGTLQELFQDSTNMDEALILASIKEVLGDYKRRVEAMNILYLEILDIHIKEPFEKAQVYILSMINHLLGSVYDFNDQTINVFDENLYGASVALDIDLDIEMKKFTKWFDEVKEQTVLLMDEELAATSHDKA